MADRFFIAPYEDDSGLRSDQKPWLIPDQAFAELTNAYVFRGRVRKRFGSKWTGKNGQLSSRLAIKVAGTWVGTNFVGTIPAEATRMVGQMFSVGQQIFTVVTTSLVPEDMLATGDATVATFWASTGIVVITTVSGAGLPVYFYQSLPVMGLPTIEDGNLNAAPNIAFDTRFAYQWNGSMWLRLDGEVTPGASVWVGSDTQFFWTTTWTGTKASDTVFFVTNDNQLEPNYMRSFFGGKWDNFRPKVFDGTDPVSGNPMQIYLDSALILLPFKNRLLAANTWETTVINGVAGPSINYRNRVRYCQIGSPLDINNGWRQDIPGKGNGIDCSTLQQLTSMEFVKDRLITYFERSTYELLYTGNQAYPFSFQQINTELGVDATFSIVPFDKVAIGIGGTGIMACNGSNVERIDDKVPDYVFEIDNNLAAKAIERVYGIRDYFVEQIYWTIPSNNRTATTPYPDQVLVYNYKKDTWAINEDSITCFGYMQDVTATGVFWDSEIVNWDSDVTWDSGTLTVNNRQVIAGNQQGYVFVVDPETPTNAMVLQITDITMVGGVVTIMSINHNIPPGSYIYLNGITGDPSLTALNNTIVRVVSTTEPDLILTDAAPFTGKYTGGGTLARVSNISIKTKEYNFYASQGLNAAISKIDFMVDRTDSGEITVDYFVSTSTASMLQGSNSFATDALVGLGTLETFAYPDLPYEATSSRLWRSIYVQAQGEVIQLWLTMSPEEMKNVGLMNSPFQLHAMCFYAQPTGRLS